MSTNAKHFHIKNDATFDNIGIYTTESGAIHIACGYNNVTFTETFKSKAALLAAGVVAFNEDKTSGWYNSRESVGSDEDCTITVNGGDFSYFMGGNYLYNGNYSLAIYGTYSGNMTINVGPNVVIRDNIRNGACGQNYLTGTITLNLATWPEGKLVREYSWLGGSNESKEYKPSNNTGTITVNFAEGLERTVAKAGDIDTDGMVDIKDMLLMLDYVLNGAPASVVNAYSPYYYGITTYRLLDVVSALKALAK